MQAAILSVCILRRVYKLTNSEENKLGLPMPSGVVRFYDKDGSGELQFIGAADMAQLAKGEKAELAIGEAFDIYADGKITAQNKLSEKMAGERSFRYFPQCQRP